MRPWLLLMTLLVSDLSLLGDGDWIMDYFCWSLCSKLLLSRQRTPSKDQEIILSKTDFSCQCFQLDFRYVAEQRKQRSLSISWAQRVHNTCRHTNQDMTKTTQRNELPALALSLFCGELIPIFLVKLKAPTALHGMDIIKNRTDPRSVGLHHPSSASSQNFPAFLLEKSQTRVFVPIGYLQKMLTKRCCASAAVVIPRCVEDSEKKSAMTIERASVKHTASKLELDIKKNKHFNLKKDSIKEQISSKVTSIVDTDDISVQRQLLLESRVNKGSINWFQIVKRPTLDKENIYYNEKLTIKRTQLRFTKGENKAYANEDGNRIILTQIRQTHLDKKMNEVRVRQIIPDVGEDGLLILFLANTEMEAQTETPNERKLASYMNMRWETVNPILKELVELPPITMVMKDVISEADESKSNGERKRLVKTKKAAIMDIKQSERKAEVTTVSGTTENTGNRTEEVKNMTMNHRTEGNMPEEESMLSPPPSIKMMQAETTKTGFLTETTTTKMNIPDKTHTENDNLDNVRTTDGWLRRDQSLKTTTHPEPEPETEPRLIKCKKENTQATSEILFSGLRMRDDVLNETSVNWIKSGGEKNQNELGVKSPMKHSGLTQKETMDHHPKTIEDVGPLCRGLIHRTKSGWKHCLDRLGQPPSKLVSVWEVLDARRLQREPPKDRDKNPFIDDDDHFYYYNGILKRVQNSLYAIRERRRRRSDSSTRYIAAKREKEYTHENFLSFIQRLVQRNKDNHNK